MGSDPFEPPSGRNLAGLELSEAFYKHAVLPVLAKGLPGLRFGAARLGSGSDVLGLDDEWSRDHDWGCRLNLFVAPRDFDAAPEVIALLQAELPETFHGLPVQFPTTWDATSTHKVSVDTVADFAQSRLGVCDAQRALSPIEWCSIPGQAFLELTAGRVFSDPDRVLTDTRDRLQRYPDDVRLYVLSAGWNRVRQELPFVGRTGALGDDLGSRMIAARLARDIAHLAFVVSHVWTPYPKWAGSMLQRLPVGAAVADHLGRCLAAESWEAREAGLVQALEVLAGEQASLGLHPKMPASEPFFDRPYRIANGEIEGVLWNGITDGEVTALPRGVGSIEQWVDSVDVLSSQERRRVVQAAYKAMVQPT